MNSPFLLLPLLPSIPIEYPEGDRTIEEIIAVFTHNIRKYFPDQFFALFQEEHKLPLDKLISDLNTDMTRVRIYITLVFLPIYAPTSIESILRSRTKDSY